MDKVQKGVRLPADVNAQVEAYATEHNISESDAMRRLLLYGLERENGTCDCADELARIEEAVTQPFWRRLF
jgi:hypothetical protein